MRDATTVSFGEAHPFWDVYPSDDAYDDAEVEREDMSSISVSVDEGTGDVELNAGYAPGSPQNDAERALFAEVREDVVAALVDEMSAGRLSDPTYDAFKARHAAPAPR